MDVVENARVRRDDRASLFISGGFYKCTVQVKGRRVYLALVKMVESRGIVWMQE